MLLQICFVIKLCIKIYKRKTQYVDINKFKNINKTKNMKIIVYNFTNQKNNT